MAGAMVLTGKSGALHAEGKVGTSTMVVQTEVHAIPDAADVRCRMMVVHLNGVSIASAGQHPMSPLGVIEYAGLRRCADNSAHGERDTSPRVFIHLVEPRETTSSRGDYYQQQGCVSCPS